MLVASCRRALRTSMKSLRDRGAIAICRGGQSGDAIFGGGESFTHAVSRGCTNDVATLERRLQGHRGKEITPEFRTELLQLLKREVAELAILVETVADGVPDLLVGLAEGD